jgi:hypothetical protein
VRNNDAEFVATEPPDDAVGKDTIGGLDEVR